MLTKGIKKMTDEEIKEKLVNAGIYTNDGKLTINYGGKRKPERYKK